MSLEQLQNAVMSLAGDERKRFAQWFYKHEDQIDPADEDLSSEVETELRTRLAELREHPELIQPWDGTIDRVRQRLHELRSQENPPC